AHAPPEWGVMAIGTGGLVSLDRAESVSGISRTEIVSDARLNVLAAARVLAAEAATRGPLPNSEEGWAPAITAYGGEVLGDEVMAWLSRGFSGTDDRVRTLVLEGHGVKSECGIGTLQQALGYPGAIWNPA